tara:strand:- start:4820 stop:6709 length:1890 start_codon:yes stop_codon:yes gene_type:complete
MIKTFNHIKKNFLQIFTALFLSINVLIILRYPIQDGLNKNFIEILIFFLLLVLISISIINIQSIKDLNKNELFLKVKSVGTPYLLFVYLLISILFIFQFVPFNTFGDRVFSLSLIFFIIILFYIFKIQDSFLESLSFRKKSILYIFFTLIPIIRYLISNTEILFFIEQVKLISYFFLISFLLIFVFSNIVDNVLETNLVLPIMTVFLFIAFEMNTLSNTFEWARNSKSLSLAFLYMAIFAFILVIDKYSARQISFIFLILGIISIYPNISLDSNNPELNKIKSTSPFSNEFDLENKYSIIFLIYDGYPQNETLDLYGFDNSTQTQYLKEHGFKIYNGVYSHGAYSLATMAGVFQGQAKVYDERNARLMTGGYSSFNELLKDNGYLSVGIFSSSFYLPPTREPNYDIYFPSDADRSLSLFTSLLRGRQVFKDLTFSKPHEIYLNQKLDFLKGIDSLTQPVFLYSHSNYPGHTQNSGVCEENEENMWKLDLDKANNEMKNDISELEDVFENSFIIIAGDHGPYLTKNCTSLREYNPEDITRLDIQDRYGTFLAIRPPTGISLDFEKKILQNVLLYISEKLSRDDVDFNNYINEESINNSELPQEINIFNNLIQGGINNNQPLYLDRSTSTD